MNEIIEACLILSFMWLPLVFAAYAIGRQKVGIRFLLIFVAMEAAALALAKYLDPWIFSSLTGLRE